MDEIYGLDQSNGKDEAVTVNFEIVQSGSLTDQYIAKLKQDNEDYKLMLKALTSGWEVWLGDNKWIWDDISEFDVRFVVPSTQSDIPEINDELREEFKKI